MTQCVNKNYMFNENPKVSVIIPTYNREHLISRSIESVLNQTYKDFEVIIVDDASTDNTEELITKKYPDVIYIKHDINRGAAAARNTGLNVVRGKYIAFHDSDDEWLPEKLEKQMVIFEKFPEVGIVYTDMLRISEDGRMDYWNSPSIQSNTLINEKTLDYQVTGIGIQSTVILKECIEYVGFFDDKLPRLIDLELFIRLSKYFKFYHLREPLVKYYENDGISTNIIAGYTARIYLLNKFFECLKGNKKFLAKQYYDIGYSMMSIGNLKSGRNYLIKAIKSNPIAVKSLVLIAISLAGQNAYKKILNIYNMILRRPLNIFWDRHNFP